MKRAPDKYDMIYYLRCYDDRNYAWDCPYKVIKKAFAENGGFDWWNNKNKEIK
tara:strand:- start:41 stop:199 length:159 start_codon:yes stop_codon:yes gene_type:complete